jgi:hypothetical protein
VAVDLTAVWRVVRCAVHLEDNFHLSVDFCGRRSLDRENSWTLEMSGRFLGYQIQHDNTALFLKLREMDGLEEWQPVLRLLDTVKSWETIYEVIAGLEKHEVKSLARPIRIGEVWDAGDCIVIS